MKKLFGILLWLLALPSYAQFTPGQVLTAAELNNQFALYAPLAAATFSGPVTFNGTVGGTGITTLLSSYLTISNAATTYAPIASPTFTGTPAAPTAATATNTTQLATTAYVVNKLATPTAIGSGTANTGAFTALSASSTVSGTGFSTYLASPPAIGTTTRAAGNFTALAANGGLTVSGGAIIAGGGSLDGATIGFTTPSTGAFTTLSSTGNFTPSQTNGIVGTTTNNNANAGSVGEFVTNTATGVSLTTSVAANITSISLTAGDWDVIGNIWYQPAASTIISNGFASINTTSATLQAGTTGLTTEVTGSAGANINVSAIAPKQRISLATTTTVYLVGSAAFTVSTCTASGNIQARRVR